MFKNIPRIRFLLLLIALTACKTNKEEMVVHSIPDYLPLQVGNYWELAYPNGKTTILRLDTVVNIGVKAYFRIVSSGYLSFNDTAFYRKDPYWKVYQKRRGTEEVLMFDFGVPVNYKWILQTDQNNRSRWVTLQSKTDTVQRSHYTFENCYRYFFDTRETADDEFWWILAPGVGFVKSSNSSFPGPRLIRARIDGKDISAN